MRKTISLIFLLLTTLTFLTAQHTTLEGYVFEDGNRGYLNEVRIKILQKRTNQLVAETATNRDGFFTVRLPISKTYIIESTKDLFHPLSTDLVVKKGDKGKKVFTKIKLIRKPGYLFDVTLAERMKPGQEQVDAIIGSRIEVYNNTNQQTILDYPNHPLPTFKVNFERGNHYSILVRKAGFYAKRLEAFVDIKGCILCFEGVGNVKPGVSDVLTEKNQMGTLLANVDLQKTQLNQTHQMNNIQFINNNQLNEVSYTALKDFLTIAKDNPDLTFEIGVHTDSRGADNINLSTSQEQAYSIVNYLNNSGKVQPNQLVAKGYGETQLLNGCGNNVPCEPTLHQQNRRVEWKVIKQAKDQFLSNRSLAQIIEVERFNEGLNFGNQEQLVVRSGEAVPSEIANDVDQYNQSDRKINPPINPDGISYTDVIYENDPYAEVTNATRLVDEHYTDESVRENLKRQPIPTAYTATPVRINPGSRSKPIKENRDLPGNFNNGGAIDQRITPPPSPQLGETVVATAATAVKTITIPTNFTGYKIEFLTSLTELSPRHDIFRRHGNIAIERKTNGVYSYLLGSFTDKVQAEVFLNESILERYPSASLVFYENGKRPVITGKKKVKIKPVSAPPR